MITCIVLAAGESQRFQGNKLLFEIKPNITILEFLLKSITASRVDRTVVVLGHEAGFFSKKVQGLSNESLHIVINPDYRKGGMSSSIRRGLELSLDSHALLITPADIPLIPSKVFNQLIDYFYSHISRIIIPTFQNQKGHPILISSELFEDVKNISEEKRGMKEILTRFIDDIVFLSTNSPEILLDVDKHEDLIKLKSFLET
ncbi:MAG: NTP transferase domain-containing protein [Promethearchaeota archaeon]